MPPLTDIPWLSAALSLALVAGAAGSPPIDVADEGWEEEFRTRLDWWSLRPMGRPEPPAVADAAWMAGPVDRFLNAALDQAGIPPAPPADPWTWRRRLSFVLTGLPPDLERPFTGEESEVDHLLASPRFGERFARHWMDVIRYTDTYGYEWDNPAKGSHEYRDYLIRAFNDDIGFDQLLREQIAGDLLPEPRLHPVAGTNESLIGPMSYHFGEHRHGSSLMFNGIHQEMVHNKIDAFSKAFLATTVACARCHDHKLEAVSQRDYYALAALFTTPRWTTRVIDLPAKNDAAIARLKDLRAAIRAELAGLWSERGPWGDTSPRVWAEAHRPALTGVGTALPPLLDEPDAWPRLAEAWRKDRAAAREANRAFRPLPTTGWVFEGDGLTHGEVEEATPLIALEGDAVLSGFLAAGWHTRALSPKLPGSLRMPPQHLVPGRFVSLELAGGEFGGHLVVDDHAFQNETVAFYTNAEPAWRSFADAELKHGVQQVTVEFATAPLHPNFPPRTGVAKGLPNSDFGHDKRSWISVTGIVTHDTAGTPRDELDAFTGLYEGEAPADEAALWQRVAAWAQGAVLRWRENRTAPGDRQILAWLLDAGLLPNRAEPGTRLARLIGEYRNVEAAVPFPRTAMSMDERENAPARYPLNVRGNVDVTGALVGPAFLEMLDGGQVADRLALADSLLEPGHPLTARVYVNRVWQWIFGTGLVATPDDFGRLGDQPSHPELLDWLASEFIREGWSTKKLVRRLVLSEAFRQSGTVSATARERDPANRLLHHYPTRRLEAEAIRDSLLALSGRLDPRLYGRPILPYRTAEDDKKRLFSGPLDGGGRRSIYLQMSIMDPPKFLAGFNLPDLKLPTGRRDVTNVPAQALILLNDPFVHAMARHWAERLAANGPESREERVRSLLRDAFSRPPGDAEVERWSTALEDFGGDDVEGWAHLAHAVFNTKEFLHYR